MKVLIIDDEKNIRITLKSIIEDEGLECETAENGYDGLKLLEEDFYEIVFLDVKMDGLDGIEVLKKISADHKYVQVIMISGHSSISDAVKALRAGAFDFLEKPLSYPKIKSTLELALKFININRRYNELLNNSGKQLLIGSGVVMSKLKTLIAKVARTNSKVLIRGESGTGKELIAHAIHSASPRAESPFIKFNSAAIPNELVESELFGYERGAFTGAVKSKKGKIEEANGGTLFLDEIGDMTLTAQSKILRVIQEGEFERVGSNNIRRVDARIIAATHKDLEDLVNRGLFRQDLYYRLNVVPVVSPPLRDRREDIPELIDHFSAMMSSELGVKLKTFSGDAVEYLVSKQYPGNVRELRNLIERLYILCDSQKIDMKSIPEYSGPKAADCDEFWEETQSWQSKKKEFELKYLTTQLKKHNCNISSTAKALSLHQSNLSRKLKELEIKL